MGKLIRGLDLWARCLREASALCPVLKFGRSTAQNTTCYLGGGANGAVWLTVLRSMEFGPVEPGVETPRAVVWFEH